jgi:hypothetical protein
MITALVIGIACCFVGGCVLEWLGRPRSPVARRTATKAHQRAFAREIEAMAWVVGTSQADKRRIGSAI